MDSISIKYSFSEAPFDLSAKPSADAMARGLPNGEDFFGENCPRIGSSFPSESGVNDLLLPEVRMVGSLGVGWLYMAVAASTVEAPMRKEGVTWKSKSTTDERNERMMEMDVAKPLRMLSEYLMTTAVTRPPNT